MADVASRKKLARQRRSGYERQSPVEVGDPAAALQRASIWALLGGTASLSASLVMPWVPPLQWAVGGLSYWMAWRWFRGVAVARAEFQALVASRKYELQQLPQRRGDDGAPTIHGKVPWGPLYEPPSPGWTYVDEERRVYAAAGITTQKAVRKQLVGTAGEQETIYRAQEAWLHAHLPARWRAVQRWYAQEHLLPYLTTCYPLVQTPRILAMDGTVAPELVAGMSAWWSAVASQAADALCPILPLGHNLAVSWPAGGTLALTLTSRGEQALLAWLSDPARGLVVVDRVLRRRMAARGLPDLQWLERDAEGRSQLVSAALGRLEAAVQTAVCGGLGVLQRGDAQPADWDREYQQHLAQHYEGATSLAAWLRTQVVAARTTVQGVLDLLRPDDPSGSAQRLCAHYLPTVQTALAELAAAGHLDADAWAGRVVDEGRAWTAVDYWDGIRLALQPSRWEDREDVAERLRPLARLGRHLLALPGSLAPAAPPDYPRWRRPVTDAVFLGRGFFWDVRHLKAYQEHLAHNLSDLTDNPEDQGDPRIYATGLKDVENVFQDEAIYAQHTGIFGASGVGKTRFVEPSLVYAIQNGFPLLIIDPKTDEALLNRTFDEARRAGRANDVLLFALAAPRNAEVSTYNGMASYRDPAELGSRGASIIANASDPFWKDTGVTTLRTLCTLMHWVQQYLCVIGAGATGTPVAIGSRQVPPLLQALLWRRYEPQATPAQAEAGLQRLRAAMAEPGWKPSTPLERALALMLAQPLYQPRGWTPNFRILDEYAIARVFSLLAWALKIVYGHLYVGASTPEQRAPMLEVEGPEQVSFSDVLSFEDSGKSMPGGPKKTKTAWQSYKQEQVHPLATRYDAMAQGLLGEQAQELLPYFEHFVAKKVPTAALRDALQGMQDSLAGVFNIANQEQKTYTQHMSTLRTALARFRGMRERILNALDPEIRMRRVVDRRQIVYFQMASLIDPDGSTAVAKLLMQDLTSYFGEVESFRQEARCPIWVIGDEVGSWLNDATIDVLARGRSAGGRITLIGQSTADFEALFRDRAKASQAMSNLSTIVQLRTTLESDAKPFCERVGEAIIHNEGRSAQMSPGYGNAGNTNVNGFSVSDSRSYNEQRLSRIAPSAIMNLPRGQAFIHSMARTFLVAAPLLPPPAWNVLAEFGILDAHRRLEQDLEAHAFAASYTPVPDTVATVEIQPVAESAPAAGITGGQRSATWGPATLGPGTVGDGGTQPEIDAGITEGPAGDLYGDADPLAVR